MEHRQCSSCDSALRAVFARGVELDWCPFCGGLFFDRGELASVLKREVSLTREGQAMGACAGCGGNLTQARIGGLSAKACDACDGVFLEGGEIDQLAGQKVGLLQVPTAPREQVTFKCGFCGDERPIEQGLTTSRGLVCAGCRPLAESSTFSAPPVVVDDTPRDMASLALNVASSTVTGDAGMVLQIVSFIFDLFA